MSRTRTLLRTALLPAIALVAVAMLGACVVAPYPRQGREWHGGDGGDYHQPGRDGQQGGPQNEQRR